MLELDRIRVCHGAATALWDVSIRIGAGELVCVVGPNGAGKTTLIEAIAGLNSVASGRLSLEGRDLTHLAKSEFCDQGIAIVPEGRRLFTGLTVLENLELGSYRKTARANRRESLDRVFTLFPVLKARLTAPAGTLSGGQQQMLAIGRALMARPRYLLLDEPSLGLAPAVVMEMFSAIQGINRAGMAVLLVEQDVAMALDIAARAYVLEEGRIAAEGSPRELLAAPHIRRAYLGESE
jgi:branched-chain amino acid transport system ATP-binding protein